MSYDYDEYGLDYEIPPVNENPEPEPLTKVASALWDKHRDAACQRCALSSTAYTVCMFGNGDARRSALAVVADYPTDEDEAWGPFSVAAQQWAYLRQVAAEVNVDVAEVYRTYAVRCAPPRTNDREKLTLVAVKECAPFLWRELWEVRPKAILTLGAAAYYAFTRQRGLSNRRGQAFELSLPCACSGPCCEGTGNTREEVDGRVTWTLCECKGVCHAHEGHSIWVVPTFNPRAVLERPSAHEAFVSDVAKWRRLGLGVDLTPEVEIVEVRSLEGLRLAQEELLATVDKVLTFDLETRGFVDQRAEYAKVWCAAFTTGHKGKRGTRVFQIPLEHPEAPWFDPDEPLPANATSYPDAREAVQTVVDLVMSAPLNGHNVKFDVRHVSAMARRYALPVSLSIGFDTFVAAHVLDENRGLSLLDQCSVALGVNNWGKGVQSFGIGEVDDLRELLHLKHLKERLSPLWGVDGMGYYCARDTAYCHELYNVQRQRLREDPDGAKLLRKLSLPGLNAFCGVEENGIYVNVRRLFERDAVLEARWNEARATLLSYVHPDVLAERATKKSGGKKDLFQNDHFLRSWIYGEAPLGLGLVPFAFTNTGMPATDEDTLKLLDHPALHVLQDYKRITKARQFFVQWLEWLSDRSRLHASFNMGGTVTGRRSNSNPNLQQVPRDQFIRSVLGAPPGWRFLEVDYSQLEVRLAAWLANEETMLEIFRRGGDIYRTTAAGILNKDPADIDSEERRKAKAYVLGFLYGMGAKGFVEYARDTYQLEFTLQEAQEIREAYFALFPGLVHWHAAAERRVKKFLEVKSPAGRTRHLVNILSMRAYERGKAVRQAINSPVQGLGADFTLASVIELSKLLDPAEARIVGDVHDALLFELREDVWERNARLIMTTMEAPQVMRELCVDWPVRLIAEGQIGQHWKEGPEFTLDDMDDPERWTRVLSQLEEALASG